MRRGGRNWVRAGQVGVGWGNNSCLEQVLKALSIMTNGCFCELS